MKKRKTNLLRSVAILLLYDKLKDSQIFVMAAEKYSESIVKML